MVPADFDESNLVLGKPPNMTSEECDPLNVFHGFLGEHPVMVSCWKLTREELEEFKKTGRIWLVIWGNAHPPVILAGNKPVMTSNS